MSTEHQALITLAVMLLGTLILSTWRFSGLASKLLHAVQRLEEKEKEQDARIKLLDDVPVLKRQMEDMQEAISEISRALNHSMRPGLAKIEERMKSAEDRIGSLRLRSPWRASRPDLDGDE